MLKSIKGSESFESSIITDLFENNYRYNLKTNYGTNRSDFTDFQAPKAIKTICDIKGQ